MGAVDDRIRTLHEREQKLRALSREIDESLELQREARTHLGWVWLSGVVVGAIGLRVTQWLVT